MKVEAPYKVRGSEHRDIMDRQAPEAGRQGRSRYGDSRAACAYQRHALVLDRMPLRTQSLNKAESVKVIGRPRSIRLASQHICGICQLHGRAMIIDVGQTVTCEAQ